MFNFFGKIILDDRRTSAPRATSANQSRAWDNGFFYNAPTLPVHPHHQLYHHQTNNSHLSITGDIHLYNRRELADKLNIAPPGNDFISDCLLLAAAYDRWGPDCVLEFNGDFTFGLWDHGKNTFFAACDAIGVKQFYYHLEAGKLRFGNNLKEMFTDGGIGKDINCGHLTDYLLDIYPDPSQTVYKDIKQLPPGHLLLIRHGESRPAITSYREEVILSSNQGGLSLKHSLLESLRSRLDTTIGNGFLLSGGLDSSSLVCLAAKELHLGNGDLKIFSKVPDRDSYDGETEYLESVLRHTGFSPHLCSDESAPGRKFYNNYYEKNYDFPFNPFFQVASPLREMIRGRETFNIISGLGGDETASHSGDFIYAYFLLRGHWGKIRQLLNSGLPLAGTIKREIIRPLLPPFLRRIYHNLRTSDRFRIQQTNFINSACMEAGEVRRALRARTGGWTKPVFLDPRQEIIHTLKSGYMYGPLTLFNGLGRLHENNVVFPFLDLRVIRSCLSASAGAYRHNNIPRSLLRNSVKDIIPAKISERREKADFGRTASFQLLANPSFASDILDMDNKLAWSVMDREMIRRAYGEIKSGKLPNSHSEGMSFQVAKCLNVAAFLQWLEETPSAADTAHLPTDKKSCQPNG